jgi:hypothetical protein
MNINLGSIYAPSGRRRSARVLAKFDLLLLTLPLRAILGCSLFYCSYRGSIIYLSTLKKSWGELES